MRMAVRGFVAGILLPGCLLWMPPPVQARECPLSSAGGKTIGWIEFDDVRVPLKKVSYPAGGVLDPPATNKAAGLSTRHRGLQALRGTSVITWHTRFGKGCPGTLNPILGRSIGSEFDLVSASGARQTYRLVDRAVVPRGRYRPAWFRLMGPRQIALFTCSDFQDGGFRRTTALFAEPVTP